MVSTRAHSVKKTGERSNQHRKYKRGEEEFDVMTVTTNARTKKGTRARRTVQVSKNRPRRGIVRVGGSSIDMMLGKVDLDDWSDQDLMMGFKREKGQPGTPPHVIPIDVHQELQRRVISRAQHRFYAELGMAVEKLVAIVAGIETKKLKDGTIVAKDVTAVQLKAIDMLMDRTLGKPLERVDLNVGVKKPWQELVEAAIVPNIATAAEMESRRQAALDVEAVKP